MSMNLIYVFLRRDLTVFNQKTLYNAYKKRTKNIDIDLEEYNKMKEADPEFYLKLQASNMGRYDLFEKSREKRLQLSFPLSGQCD